MLKILLIALLVLEAVCVPLFLRFYWPKRCKKSLIMKTVSSLIFIACAGVCMAMSGNDTKYALYILLGLVFGMLGDVLLHWIKGTPITFISGVVLFLVGHIFYISAFDAAIRPGSWDTAVTVRTVVLVIGAVIIAVAAAFIYFRKIFKGREYYIVAAAVYGGVLFTMLAKAFECAMVFWEYYEPGIEVIIGSLEEWQVAMIAVICGSVLFVISDLLLGFMLAREHGKSQKPPIKVLRYINIYTYYIAQLILAISILLIPYGIGWAL